MPFLRRVRYTLETLSVAWEEPVKPHVKTLVDIQDVLGEMQDRAVLREKIAHAFGDGWTEDGGSPPDDINLFLAHGDSRRRYLLGRARTSWKKMNESGFLEHLRTM